MVDITVTIANVEEFVSMVQGWADSIRDEVIPNSLRKAGEQVIDGAKEVVPVRTGHLRDSIDIQGEGQNFIEVGADADYAAFVEFGTSRMEAQPYMTPQINRLRGGGFQSIFRDEFNSSVRR